MSFRKKNLNQSNLKLTLQILKFDFTQNYNL
jgi:hypothetical protein